MPLLVRHLKEGFVLKEKQRERQGMADLPQCSAHIFAQCLPILDILQLQMCRSWKQPTGMPASLTAQLCAVSKLYLHMKDFLFNGEN